MGRLFWTLSERVFLCPERERDGRTASQREVPASCLVVAVDLGKALNRVWLTTGERGLTVNRCEPGRV